MHLKNKIHYYKNGYTKMKIKISILLVVLFFFWENKKSYARPRTRSKSCAPKVLLPGHNKPVNCRKARKMKNAYF